MADIVSKLNLNKTPNKADNNSLVFAKNIRLDVDGSIHRDYGILPMSIRKFYDSNIDKFSEKNIVGRIIRDISYNYDGSDSNSIYAKIKDLLSNWNAPSYKSSFNIVGIVSDVAEFYIFFDGYYNEYVTNSDNTETEIVHHDNCIIKYDEATDLFTPCDCNWTWSGGNIDGYVANNLIGEKILIIGESNANTIVPIKSINLTKSSYTNNETIYTQTPNIPLTNINSVTKFVWTIPNGVYQFYVRYKIRDEFYTNWFPASRELFAGNHYTDVTNFGTLYHTNTRTDSNESFILTIEHKLHHNVNLYESYQIGFILSHDDSIVARAWKHFNLNTTLVYFDYNAQDAQEIEITDLTKPVYNIYDVGSITSFKNKIYISNYTETDFNDNNEEISECVKNINIELKTTEEKDYYGDHEIITSSVNNKTFISGLKIETIQPDGTSTIENKYLYSDDINKSLTYDLFNTKTYNESIVNNFTKLINNSIVVEDTNVETKKYGLRTYLTANELGLIQRNLRDNIITFPDYFSDVSFDDDNIKGYYINNEWHSVNLSNLQNGINDVIDNIFNYIYSRIVYLNLNGRITDGNGNITERFSIDLVRYATYKGKSFAESVMPEETENEEGDFDLSTGNVTIETKTIPYKQNIAINIYADSSLLNNNNVDKLINLTTLIPYQIYNFYVHFVKESGETTNGYFCKEIKAPYVKEANTIVYPVFSNIKIPKSYVACFFSILHKSNKVATIYDIDNSDTENVLGSCMEFNTRDILGYRNIDVAYRTDENINNNEDSVTTADYYHSSDYANLKYFGANGIVKINNNEDNPIESDNLAYSIFNYTALSDDNASLIKCTPYITDVEYSDYTSYNLLGYICRISPLDRDTTISHYTDGAGSVYHKDVNNTSDNNSSANMALTELGKYSDSEYKISMFRLKHTDFVNIYSNFNYNYLSLSEDVKLTIATYYNYSSESYNPDSDSSTNANQVLWRLISSLTMSDIYNLSSMYKSYTRKTYTPYTKNNKTRFDNTVRSSILEGDEAKINIYKFDANDYYNIPTNRGTITNLLSVGDAIIVHTKDSMFKFSGSNTISSNDGEIQTQENEVFNTGVSEVFGADYGFAGLQNKRHHIVTELGYIFFDKNAKVIYLYSGQGQLVKISDSIEKLLRHEDIKNIYFANDYYNNRFFISIKFFSNTVTLSYSVLQDIKSFVSIHDFGFTYAFNTRTKCYFLTNDRSDITTITKDNKYTGCYYKIDSISKLYPYVKSSIGMIVNPDLINPETLTIPKYQSIIDVIFNENYEIIKTLNAIQWCSRFVSTEFTNIDTNNNVTSKMADVIEASTPCSSLLVYTDTCTSKKIEFSQEISNSYSINNPNSYKLPRYNQGKWSLNYFRDIENANNTGKYLGNPIGTNSRYDDGRTGAEYRSDNNALIEGKYFVIRFFFDDNFKLETLTLNYDNKL